MILIAILCAFSQTATYQRAATLFDQGQYEKSLAELDQVLVTDPHLIPALTLKAKLAMSINRNDVAHETLATALATDPAAPYAQFLLGFLFYRENRMPEAVPALEKARPSQSDRPSPDTVPRPGEETLGATVDALRLYQEAMQLETASGKPHAEAWITCARLMMVEGDLDGAAGLLKKAVELEPRSRGPHFESGRLLLKKGRPS